MLNKIPVKVTKNLEAALKILRSKIYVKAGWKAWIDALCINQADPIERATQVKRMREIYVQAWTPIVWLGEGSDDSYQAINLILKLNADYDHGDQIYHLYRILETNPKLFSDGSWRSLHDFITRRYWSRAWILQEASLGTDDMPVLCGKQTLRWVDISHAFWLLHGAEKIFNVYMTDELEKVGRSLDLAVYENLHLVDEIQQLQQGLRQRSGELDLYRTMTLSRAVSATNPRDQVYGLLALMGEKLAQQIRPDYTATCEDVYSDFVKSAIDVTQTLEILRHVGISQSLSQSLSLPSWVPD
jgi:hypothetical protein